MDDYAEIGPANHLGYEKRQQKERAKRNKIPQGECIFFDEAFERGMLLQQLELSKVDVNMFGAINRRRHFCPGRGEAMAMIKLENVNKTKVVRDLIKKRFWSIDNTDINRMFPGYDKGETTQRIAAGIFEKIKDYKVATSCVL